MTRIVVQALHADGEPRRWTLSERIVPENLDSDHYVRQLVERLRWATADAEALESPTDDLASGHDGEAQRLQSPIRSTGTDASARPGSRRGATDRRGERTLSV